MKTNTITKARVDERLFREIIEVKETIATGVVIPAAKVSTFCVADLWNIHKQKRQRVPRRFL